jgi:hypothetical protein
MSKHTQSNVPRVNDRWVQVWGQRPRGQEWSTNYFYRAYPYPEPMTSGVLDPVSCHASI